MPNKLSDLKAALKTAANGLTGGGYTLNAARVVIGYDYFSASDTEFWSTIAGTGDATSGPYLLIGRAALIENDLQMKLRTYEIKCSLYNSIVRETDNTLANQDDLCEALRAAWDAIGSDGTMYEDESETDNRQTPIKMISRFTATMRGCG